MRDKLKNLLKLSTLVLTAIMVMVAYQPVSVLASREYLSFTVSRQQIRRTDSYTGNADFNIQFTRTEETPVSITFEAVVTAATERLNQELKYYVESLYSETPPIVPRVLALDEIRRQTTYEDRPVYTPTVVNYTSRFGNYENVNSTYFKDYSQNGQTVVKEGFYETWSLPTLTWSWTEQVQTGTEQVPVYTYTTVNYASHLGTESPTYPFSINPNTDRGWGNGILHFRARLDNGLIANPNGGWGSSGILVIEINGVKYYDTANSSWWDALWLRRKQITIAGTADGAQTNYQLKLNVYKSTGTDSGNSVYLGTNVQDDFDDLRFTTDAEPNVSISHWIESYVSGTSAVVWIEFDSIPASPSSDTWYIYYNYTSATSASNGANTFILFDHFDDASLDTSKWVTTYGGYVESGTELVATGTGTYKGIGTDGISSYGTNRAFRTRAKLQVQNAASGAGFGFWDAETAKFGISASAATWQTQMYDGVTSTNDDVSITDDTYYVFEVQRNGSTNVKWYQDTTLLNTETTNLPDANCKLLFLSYQNTKTLTADWILVRNITLNEPTWGTWGAEEIGGTATVYSPSANTSGTLAWTNPDRAYSSNNQYATVSPTYGSTASNQPTANAAGSYTQWTNPANAYDGGSNQYATATISASSETQRPTGDDADTQSCTVYPASPSTRYDKVDESVADDADYVTVVTNGGGHTTYTFSAFSIPAGSSIIDVTVYLRGNNGGSAHFRPSMKIGSTYYDSLGTTHDPSSMTTYSDAITLNPKTGVAWAVSDLNRSGGDSANYLNAFGHASTDNNPDNTITQVYAVANYVPGTQYDQVYGTFGFSDPDARTITKVEIGYEAYCSVASKTANFYTSANGGSSWSSVHTSSAWATSDPGAYTYIDVTSDQTWTFTLLNNSNFKVKIETPVPTDARIYYLDNLIVRITYDDRRDYDHIWGTYGITGSGSINAVQVGYEAHATATGKLDIYTSNDGGSTWSSVHTTANLGTTDPDAITYIDCTSDFSWTWTTLNDTNFKVKVVTNYVSGTPAWSLDYLPVRIYTPTGTYDFTLNQSSKALGTVTVSTTYWTNGSAPTGTLDDAEAYLTFTSTGSANCDIDVHGHNSTGGSGMTLTSSSPGSNEFRIKFYKEGDDISSGGTYLTTSDQEVISNLASGGNIDGEMSIQMGSAFTHGSAQSAIVTFTSRAVS